MSDLQGKNILLGVTGGIAAYKSPDLVRRLREQGAAVAALCESVGDGSGGQGVTSGQLGVTTAGMDGPALMGLPTLYLTDAPNVRMRAWVGAVPGYRELVRGENYLERASDTLREWADRQA